MTRAPGACHTRATRQGDQRSVTGINGHWQPFQQANGFAAHVQSRATDLPSWWCILLASHDLDQSHRVKAKPLRGRFASLDTVSPAKGRQLRGGRGRFSTRRSAPPTVNGFVNATRRNWPRWGRRSSLERRAVDVCRGRHGRMRPSATAETCVALLITQRRRPCVARTKHSWVGAQWATVAPSCVDSRV